MARKHAHESYAVSEAAAALDVEVRQLDRIARRFLGYPPGVVIDLCRVASAAHPGNETQPPRTRQGTRLCHRGQPERPIHAFHRTAVRSLWSSHELAAVGSRQTPVTI